MKNNKFDILFEELLDEFRNRTDKIKKYEESCEKFDYEHCINQCTKDAQDLVEKYKNGYHLDNNGKRVNDNGELIYEADRKDNRKKVTLNYTINTMDRYVDGLEGKAFISGDTQTYLPLSFVCYQWGIHLYHKGESTQGRKFLINALKFLNLWSGAMEALIATKGTELYKEKKLMLPEKAVRKELNRTR